MAGTGQPTSVITIQPGISKVFGIYQRRDNHESEVVFNRKGSQLWLSGKIHVWFSNSMDRISELLPGTHQARPTDYAGHYNHRFNSRRKKAMKKLKKVLDLF